VDSEYYYVVSSPSYPRKKTSIGILFCEQKLSTLTKTSGNKEPDTKEMRKVGFMP
jgi:hypothetical protein